MLHIVLVLVLHLDSSPLGLVRRPLPCHPAQRTHPSIHVSLRARLSIPPFKGPKSPKLVRLTPRYANRPVMTFASPPKKKKYASPELSGAISARGYCRIMHRLLTKKIPIRRPSCKNLMLKKPPPIPFSPHPNTPRPLVNTTRPSHHVQITSITKSLFSNPISLPAT